MLDCEPKGLLTEKCLPAFLPLLLGQPSPYCSSSPLHNEGGEESNLN